MVITGKTKWAYVLKDSPNTAFEKQWTIDVILDEENKKIIEAADLGDKIKVDKDGDTVITIYRKCETSKGNPRKPPVVLDKNGQVFTEGVGNGSVCKVQFKADPWEYKKKSGVRADLQGVMVLEHVSFGGVDGDELMGVVDAGANFTPDSSDPF